jgi:hypothetical protein
MKKFIFILIFIAVQSIFICAETSFSIKSFLKPTEQPSCYLNGQVMIPVTTDKGSLYSGTIKFVTAVDNITKKNIVLSGKWYDENFKETNTIKYFKTVYFISDEYSLNGKQSYDIHLSYVPLEAIQQIEGATTLQYSVKCPGYEHSCTALNLQLDSCFTDPEYFYAYFHGIGSQNYSKIRPGKDVSYLLNFYGEGSYGVPMPRSTVVHDLKEDRFVLKIPKKDLNTKIENIKIEVKGCINQLYKVSSFLRCNVTVNIAQITNTSELHIKPQVEHSLEKEPDKIILPVPDVNISTQHPPNKEDDFVYKIIKFFKRIFRIGE